MKDICYTIGIPTVKNSIIDKKDLSDAIINRDREEENKKFGTRNLIKFLMITELNLRIIWRKHRWQIPGWYLERGQRCWT